MSHLLILIGFSEVLYDIQTRCPLDRHIRVEVTRPDYHRRLKISTMMVRIKLVWPLIGLLAVVAMSTTSLAKEVNDIKSTGLHDSDSHLCNEGQCYPRVFEASEMWEELKPGQQLPGGLDVRLNLDTGVKEAKLHVDEPKVDSSVPVLVNDSEEPQDSSHEFTKDFDAIRSLLESDPESNVEVVNTKLDDLMEFAHDYKHGYEIITHEFELLESLSCGEQLPISLRDTSTIMIISCTRNNPRVVEHINKMYPDFVDRVFEQVESLVNADTRSASNNKLIKRYLSLLDELVTESYNFSERELRILGETWEIQDRQVRIEILELVSKLFTAPSGTISNVKPSAQMWADNIQKLIQDKDIDELHIRKFFNSLYAIKREFEDVKIDSSFLNWLSSEVDERRRQLSNGIQERDLEQDSFDQKMIDGRHLVFGNPMAHRMKNWNDEL